MAKMIALQTIDLPARRVIEGDEFDVEENCAEPFVAMGKAKRKDDEEKPKRIYRRRDMSAEH